MNGVHDMGGMQGFGPVEAEPNEPVFHHDWEKTVFALNVATGMLGKWNIDMGRHSRERMPPAEYLEASYYEKWLYGLRRLLVENGLVTADELATGKAARRADEARVLRAADVPRALRNRRAARMDGELAAARFKAGDRVRTKNLHPPTHIRLPAYARDKVGVVDRDHGVFILPDAHARDGRKEPQHCYSVRFTAETLWGSSARDVVYLDLFEPYLELA